MGKEQEKSFDTKLKEAIKTRCLGGNERDKSKDDPYVRDYEYYFKELEDNLICEMTDSTRKAYIRGSGSELQPPKMHAIHSSSAMTFNIFGNVGKNPEDTPVEITDSSILPKGKYKLEYEKQLPAVKSPANLDVCLTSDDNILLFEMKMTEWLSDHAQPKKLSATYLKDDVYPNKDEKDISFRGVMQELMWNYIPGGKGNPVKKEYRCETKHFDAFQIMLHIFAIYKALHINKYPDEYKKINDNYRLPTTPKNITLVIGYWTVPEKNFLTNNEDYEIYKKMEGAMQDEIEKFTKKSELKSIKDLFLENFNVTFDVKARTVAKIYDCLEKNDEEREAFEKRYLLWPKEK